MFCVPYAVSFNDAQLLHVDFYGFHGFGVDFARDFDRDVMGDGAVVRKQVVVNIDADFAGSVRKEILVAPDLPHDFSAQGHVLIVHGARQNGANVFGCWR